MKRTPLRRISKKRAKQSAEYLRLRQNFMLSRPFCEAFCRNGGKPRNLAVHIHHMAGREGRLLCAPEHWLPVCAECHDKIHKTHVAEAYEKGFLYEAKR